MESPYLTEVRRAVAPVLSLIWTSAPWSRRSRTWGYSARGGAAEMWGGKARYGVSQAGLDPIAWCRHGAGMVQAWQHM